MNKLHALGCLFGLTLLLGCAKKTMVYEGSSIMEDFTPSKASYEYLQGKAKIVLEEDSGKITRGTLQLRAKNDSILWFSLSPGLGLEAIRGIITPKKIQIQDRIGGNDINLSHEDFERLYGVNVSLDLFQNLLWANIPYPVIYEDRLLRVGKRFELTQVRDRIRYFSKIDTKHGKVVEFSSTSLSNLGSILGSFEKFQEVNSQAFPVGALYKVAFVTPEKSYYFRVYLDWTSFELQEAPLVFPFRF